MELARSTLRGGFSVRSIFTFVLTAIIAALLWVLFVTPSIHAETQTGTWKGDSIVYDGNLYYGPTEVKNANESHGLAQGVHYYMRVEKINDRPLQQKAHIIYFTPGTDPPTAKAAQYVTYDLSSNNKTFSHPTDQKSIEVTPQTQVTQSYEQCTIDGGIGWVICPVSVTIAGAMDWLFGIVSDLIAVQPPTTGDTHSDLYVAWNIMRSIANVAFIIVFLIIIYSQLTNLGVTNYGLKKLIPRLIIGAILVNLSFYICAIAVDFSNILGYSLQDMLAGIRDNTFNIDNTDTSIDATNTNWTAVTAFVLSGGAAGLGSLAAATAGSAGSAIFLLLPLLLGLLLTILFVLLVLAARQAIIICLIIIAPLAFVAYLLPNTEKWFEKWREVFLTMLVFFPAFSLVFGGSQLAGGIIIQNSNGNIVTLIFGLAVQVAPLVITPLLLKLSGSLLGRVAGIINDPRKGIMDRTRNWSNERAEMHRQKSLSKPGGVNGLRRWGQFMDNRNRGVKEATEHYTQLSENRYSRTSRRGRLYELGHEAETQKNIISGQLDRNFKSKMLATPHLLNEEMESRVIADEVSSNAEQLNRVQEALRAGSDLSTGQSLGHLAVRSQRATRDLSLSAITIQTAKRVQQAQLSKSLADNTDRINGQNVRTWAGGRLDVDLKNGVDNGADSALTYAINLQREAENKLIGERTQLIKHYKIDGGQRQRVAKGLDVDVLDDVTKQVLYTFHGGDIWAREAAYEMQMKTGSFIEQAELIAGSGTSGYEHRTTISDAIFANGLPSKAIFFGGKFINAVSQGRIAGLDEDIPDPLNPGSFKENLVSWAAKSIIEGKIKAEDLANNDAGAVDIYNMAVRTAVSRGYVKTGELAIFNKNVAALKATAHTILDPNNEIGANASESTKRALLDLEKGNTASFHF
ncbi:MAG: hypothetical protein ABIP50_00380 [Candidatus Saccharimonadales bacterium]